MDEEIREVDAEGMGSHTVLDADTGEVLTDVICHANAAEGYYDRLVRLGERRYAVDDAGEPLRERVRRNIRIIAGSPKSARQPGSPPTLGPDADLPRATIEAPGESVEVVFHREVESYSVTRRLGRRAPTVEVFQGDVRAFGRRCAEELARLLKRPPPGPGEAPA